MEYSKPPNDGQSECSSNYRMNSESAFVYQNQADGRFYEGKSMTQSIRSAGMCKKIARPPMQKKFLSLREEGQMRFNYSRK